MRRTHQFQLPQIDSFCAPGLLGGSTSIDRKRTCFDRAALLRIISNYNQKYPQQKITYPRTATNQVLWNLIRGGMSERCGDNEWCWLDQDFLKKDDVIQHYYKPPKPDLPRKWLSTSDIDDVLHQYEDKYSDFVFMGTVPLDFDEVINEYKNMNLCLSRYKKYGFVFNLDPHDRKGSHWVSMFMDLSEDNPNPFIGFFDSYGQAPPKQIYRLIVRLKKQAKECRGVDLVYKCNTVQHQHKNTECGVYSLYFIYQCLQGYSFDEITENIILDDTVNQFRHLFFRPTVHYQGIQPSRPFPRPLKR